MFGKRKHPTIPAENRREILDRKARIAGLVQAAQRLEKSMPPKSYYDAWNVEREDKIKRIEQYNQQVEELIDEAMQYGAPSRDFRSW